MTRAALQLLGLAGLVLAASAQARVTYTDRDPATGRASGVVRAVPVAEAPPPRPAASAETLAGLRDRAYVPWPADANGPRVASTAWRGDGPVATWPPHPSFGRDGRPLDQRQPVVTYWTPLAGFGPRGVGPRAVAPVVTRGGRRGGR